MQFFSSTVWDDRLIFGSMPSVKSCKNWKVYGGNRENAKSKVPFFCQLLGYLVFFQILSIAKNLYGGITKTESPFFQSWDGFQEQVFENFVGFRPSPKIEKHYGVSGKSLRSYFQISFQFLRLEVRFLGENLLHGGHERNVFGSNVQKFQSIVRFDGRDSEKIFIAKDMYKGIRKKI